MLIESVSSADGQAEPRRCGFVALLGVPNAGKSTMTNALTGGWVAAVSPRAQTTRCRVTGIMTEGASQIILTDTPGVFQPKSRLGRAMVSAAWSGAADSDIITVLVDSSLSGTDAGTKQILEWLVATKRKAVLLLTKTDRIAPARLLPLAATLNGMFAFDATFMVSAQTGDGLGDLRRHFARSVPEGPWHYPEDQISDLPARLMAAEMTREQIFCQLRREVPYATTVDTEGWEERLDGSVLISQAITVERDSLKPIIIGQGGRQLRMIGTKSRVDLEQLLGRPVHLRLFVRVRRDWQEDPEHYRPWGLAFDA